MSAALEAIYARAEVRAVRADGLYFHLELDLPSFPKADPGQFIMMGPGDPEAAPADPLLMRPMSILAQEPGRLSILFKKVGRVTAMLAEASPGDALRLLGPLGRAFTIATAPPPILVGGGAGVPPLCFLSRRLSGAGIAHRLLFGFGQAADLPLRAIESLDLAPEIFTLDGSLGRAGHPVMALAEDRPAGRIQACGPPAMLEALKKAALPGEALELSLEERMACGMGFCRGCVVPVADGDSWRYATVCREGPVFDAADLADSALSVEGCCCGEGESG